MAQYAPWPQTVPIVQMEILMRPEIAVRPDVMKIVTNARAAFEQGKLNTYVPLRAAGTGYGYCTSMVSWGPMMRK